MGKGRLIIGLLAALALTGCESQEPSTETADAAEDVTLPEGLALPADTQIVSTTQVSTDGGEGTVVLLDSGVSVEELEQHFQTEAEAAGFTISIKTNSRGQRQLTGERDDGMQFDFAVALYTDNITRASLAVGRERSK